MNEYYVYPTIEAANAALVVIDGFLPVEALRDGVKVPHATKWVKEPKLMLSGEYAINRISNERLDNAGQLLEVHEGEWRYTGIPQQDRIDFITAHGQDIRPLEASDFPAIEDEV